MQNRQLIIKPDTVVPAHAFLYFFFLSKLFFVADIKWFCWWCHLWVVVVVVILVWTRNFDLCRQFQCWMLAKVFGPLFARINIRRRHLQSNRLLYIHSISSQIFAMQVGSVAVSLNGYGSRDIDSRQVLIDNEHLYLSLLPEFVLLTINNDVI